MDVLLIGEIDIQRGARMGAYSAFIFVREYNSLGNGATFVAAVARRGLSGSLASRGLNWETP